MPILLSAALALTQLAQASPQHSPEIEALLRHRDERRRAEAEAPSPMPTPEPAPAEDDSAGLSEVIPPAIAARLAQCLAKANADPALGISDAQAWVGTGGGAFAAQCHGYALGKTERWAEAAETLERGARLPLVAGRECRAACRRCAPCRARSRSGAHRHPAADARNRRDPSRPRPRPRRHERSQGRARGPRPGDRACRERSACLVALGHPRAAHGRSAAGATAH